MLRYIQISLLIIVSVITVVFLSADAYAGLQDEITERQSEIQELQRQINEAQQQVDTSRTQSRTLENEIAGMNAKIRQLTLQIRSLDYAIDETELGIQDAGERIEVAEDKLGTHRSALGRYLRITNENDQTTLTEVMLGNDLISDFFTDLHNLRVTQENIRVTIDGIKILRAELEGNREELQDEQYSLEKLKGIQEFNQYNLSGEKNSKNRILRQTKGEEAKFQQIIKRSQTDISRLNEQIYYLQQNGVSVEDAVKYGQLSAIRAGIRPAFLLAILEIESRLGRNVGSGNWKDDMYDCYVRLATIYYPNRRDHYMKRAETEKNAFFVIVNQLGLDPDSVKVSKEPTYGCGGAMGPAQFIPSTWLGYADRVAQLTGHNPPNPWNIEDAFMASAIKLANGGASSQTRAGESGAARAYIGGSRYCSSSICNSYTNSVLNKAAEIERSLSLNGSFAPPFAMVR